MGKKNIILILYIICYTSCARKFTTGTFAAVEAWKAWELELKFKDDSTFTLIDRSGCHNFNYGGHWHYNVNSGSNFIILTDTTKSVYDPGHDAYIVYDPQYKEKQLVESYHYFPVISIDTVWIISDKKMTFRTLQFDRQNIFSKNLTKKREKILEKFYIDKIGKHNFIKVFGVGKGMRQARKNIVECLSHEIPWKINE